MAAWTHLLSTDDRKVLELREPRALHGPGQRFVLLVVDMQVTACGEDRPIYEQLDVYPSACGPHAWRAIPVQQKLLATARKNGIPVIYSKHVFHPHMGLPQADPSNKFSSLNFRSEIPPEVAMQPGDILVEKQTPSCLAYTNLPLILRHLNADGMMLVGNSTSGCIRSTVIDGYAAGYRMTVIEDAVFDRIELSHASALFDMQFKLCDVISSSEALAHFDAIGRSQAAPPASQD